MSNKQIRLKYFFRHTLRNSNNIDEECLHLLNQFPRFKDYIIDLYILIKEQQQQTHERQRKRYSYETEYSKDNYNKKTQRDIVERLKQNM